MTKKLKIVLPMIILALLITLSSLTSFTVFAKGDVKMCVYGEAVTQVTPNQITVNLNISNVSNSLEEAKNLTLSQFETAKTTLSDYTINVDYFYSDFISILRANQQHCSQVNFNSQFDSFEKAKAFIELATTLENVQIQTVCFTSTDVTSAYNSALENAIENAKQKAGSVLTEQNLEIKKVCEQPAYFGGVCKDFVSLTDLENVESIDVTAKVRVFFE